MEKETFLWTVDRVPGICVRDDYQYVYRVFATPDTGTRCSGYLRPNTFTGKRYVGSNVYRVKLCRSKYLPGKAMSIPMSTG
jgi:hypothetical protein